MSTYNRTHLDFADGVLNSDKHVLVDFWAPWCMPCQMMAPVLEEISNDPALKDKLEVSKVDTDIPENQALAQQYNIRSIPNMKLFYQGKVIQEFIGFRPAARLRAELLAVIS